MAEPRIESMMPPDKLMVEDLRGQDQAALCAVQFDLDEPLYIGRGKPCESLKAYSAAITTATSDFASTAQQFQQVMKGLGGTSARKEAKCTYHRAASGVTSRIWFDYSHSFDSSEACARAEAVHQDLALAEALYAIAADAARAALQSVAKAKFEPLGLFEENVYRRYVEMRETVIAEALKSRGRAEAEKAFEAVVDKKIVQMELDPAKVSFRQRAKIVEDWLLSLAEDKE